MHIISEEQVYNIVHKILLARNQADSPPFCKNTCFRDTKQAEMILYHTEEKHFSYLL